MDSDGMSLLPPPQALVQACRELSTLTSYLPWLLLLLEHRCSTRDIETLLLVLGWLTRCPKNRDGKVSCEAVGDSSLTSRVPRSGLLVFTILLARPGSTVAFQPNIPWIPLQPSRSL